MRRQLLLGTGLLVAACGPAKPAATPVPSARAAACDKESASPLIYLVDGKPVTCTAAMSVPSTRIASVEVLKGAAAAAVYGPSAASGVVVIQTKRDR